MEKLMRRDPIAGRCVLDIYMRQLLRPLIPRCLFAGKCPTIEPLCTHKHNLLSCGSDTKHDQQQLEKQLKTRQKQQVQT